MDDYGKQIHNLTEAIKVIWGKIQDEKGHQMSDIQRRIPGEIEPANINVFPSQYGTRSGDDERKRAIHHIKEMEAKGFLPEEEATARIEHAAKAERSQELRSLISDLPAPIDPRGYWQHWDWNAPQYFLPVLITGMLVSVCSALIPGIILAKLHEFNTASGLGMFVPLLLLGICGFFTNLVLLVIKTSE